MTGLQGWSVAGKAWTALAGSAASFVIPWILAAVAALPSPWPEVVGAVVAVLTAVGVYHAPYAPVGSGTQEPPSTPWPQS